MSAGMGSTEAVEALAAAWASIDGKLEPFGNERQMFLKGPLDRDAPGYTGHYEGYICEAEEMIERLRRRGFDVVPLDNNSRVSAA